MARMNHFIESTGNITQRPNKTPTYCHQLANILIESTSEVKYEKKFEFDTETGFDRSILSRWV
jgi:hypothetical protein